MTPEYQQAIDRHMREWRAHERREAIARREKLLSLRQRRYGSPKIIQKITHEDIEKILEEKRRNAKSA